MTPREKLTAIVERLHGEAVGSPELDRELAATLGLSESAPLTTRDAELAKDGRVLNPMLPGALIKVVARKPHMGDGPAFKAICWHPESRRSIEWWAETKAMAVLTAQLQMGLHVDLIPEGLFR